MAIRNSAGILMYKEAVDGISLLDQATEAAQPPDGSPEQDRHYHWRRGGLGDVCASDVDRAEERLVSGTVVSSAYS